MDIRFYDLVHGVGSGLRRQLLNKFLNSSPLWNQNIYYHSRKTSELDPFLSQLSPPVTRVSSVLKICLNVYMNVCVGACMYGFCNVGVFRQLCGCFGNMCTCIYCVFVLFLLCIFILICY